MGPAKSTARDAVALTFASLFPLGMALLYFVVLDKPDGDMNPSLQAGFAIGKTIQFLFPITYVGLYYRDHIGFVRPTLRGIPLAVGFAIFVGAAMFLLYFAWVQHIPQVRDETHVEIHKKVQQFGADSPLRFLQLALYISVLHSLAEEYYWRWFVFGWMRRHVPMFVAIFLSSVGFMLHHIVILGVYFPGHFWTLALPFAMCVAFGGGVWAWIYARSESLYAPWLCHCLIDTAIMGLGYVMLERYWT